ncbi:hypothetical protein [Streptomyces microflavus]|uniref:hypothetical protein n=1 Tax=Streptomyces microflavus TaxID=1919 RepID=UPI0034517C59
MRQTPPHAAEAVAIPVRRLRRFLTRSPGTSDLGDFPTADTAPTRDDAHVLALLTTGDDEHTGRLTSSTQ